MQSVKINSAQAILQKKQLVQILKLQVSSNSKGRGLDYNCQAKQRLQSYSNSDHNTAKLIRAQSSSAGAQIPTPLGRTSPYMPFLPAHPSWLVAHLRRHAGVILTDTHTPTPHICILLEQKRSLAVHYPSCTSI